MPANVRFAFTNSYGLPDTNTFRIQPIEDYIQADGSFITKGAPLRVTPRPDGKSTNVLAQGHYQITNQNVRTGFLIRVPLDTGPTIYDATAPTNLGGLALSGYNTFVTVDPTAYGITNALGYEPPRSIVAGSNAVVFATNNVFVVNSTGTGGGGPGGALTNNEVRAVALASNLAVAGTFSASLAGASNINVTTATGTLADERLSRNATTMLVSGTVQDARLSANVARRDQANSYPSSVSNAFLGPFRAAGLTVTNIADGYTLIEFDRTTNDLTHSPSWFSIYRHPAWWDDGGPDVPYLDEVLRMGYNVRNTANINKWYWQFETKYRSAGGTPHMVEWFLQYFNTNNSISRRPYSAAVTHDTGDVQTGLVGLVSFSDSAGTIQVQKREDGIWDFQTNSAYLRFSRTNAAVVQQYSPLGATYINLPFLTTDNRVFFNSTPLYINTAAAVNVDGLGANAARISASTMPPDGSVLYLSQSSTNTYTRAISADIASGQGAKFYLNNSYSGTAAAAALHLRVANDASGDVYSLYEAGGTYWLTGIDNSDTNKFKISTWFAPETATRFTITTNGNVGIGTSTPQALLHVAGTIYTTNVTVTGVITNNNALMMAGAGSPEGVVAATNGSVFFRLDGGAGTSQYVKETPTGNTGWVAYGSPGSALTATNSGSVGQVLKYINASEGYWAADDVGTGGSDTTAIHDDTAGEIVAIADKATPTAGDHLLIEDNDAANVKKDITIGSMETALEGVIDLENLQGAVTDGQVPDLTALSGAAAFQLSHAALSNVTTLASNQYVGTLVGNADTATSAGNATNLYGNLRNTTEATNLVFRGTSTRFAAGSLPPYDASAESGWAQIQADGIFQMSFDGDSLTNVQRTGVTGLENALTFLTNSVTLVLRLNPQAAPDLDAPGALGVQTNFWSVNVHGLKMNAGTNLVVFPAMAAGDVGAVAAGKLLKFNANGTMSPADDLDSGSQATAAGTNGMVVTTNGNLYTTHFNGTLTSSNLTGGIGGFGIKRGADPVLWATTNNVILYDRTGTNAVLNAGNNTNTVGLGAATITFDAVTPSISLNAPITVNQATFNSLTVGTHYAGITNANILGTDANGILQASAVASFGGAVTATNGFASYKGNKAEPTVILNFGTADYQAYITNTTGINQSYYVSGGTNLTIGLNDLVTVNQWPTGAVVNMRYDLQDGEWLIIDANPGVSPQIVRKPF